MKELSLNILDIVENSITAGASLIRIEITAESTSDKLSISIEDNGGGISEDRLQQIENPFYTTRTTRKIGLGIPLFKMAAINAGGDFRIVSQIDKGTSVHAEFSLSHIDRMPLGNITDTMHSLIVMNPDIDFVYRYRIDGDGFTLDTREFREILQGIPLNSAQVSLYIKEYLTDNKNAVDKNFKFNV